MREDARPGKIRSCVPNQGVPVGDVPGPAEVGVIVRGDHVEKVGDLDAPGPVCETAFDGVGKPVAGGFDPREIGVGRRGLGRLGELESDQPCGFRWRRGVLPDLEEIDPPAEERRRRRSRPCLTTMARFRGTRNGKLMCWGFTTNMTSTTSGTPMTRGRFRPWPRPAGPMTS